MSKKVISFYEIRGMEGNVDWKTCWNEVIKQGLPAVNVYEFSEGLEMKAFEDPRFVKELHRAEPRATHAFFSPLRGSIYQPLSGKSLTF